MSKKKTDTDGSEEIPKTLGHLANKDHIKKSPAMERLIETQNVLERIKTQFGYSGYSHPNYIAVCEAIEANKKIIDGKQ